MSPATIRRTDRCSGPMTITLMRAPFRGVESAAISARRLVANARAEAFQA